MQVADAFRAAGEEGFAKLIRGISMGKLRTYQMYDAFKARAHVTKLNTEALRKAAPRFWSRVIDGDEEFAKELAQAILVSHLDMVIAVLDLLGIPNENGFFDKKLDASKHLTDGWQQRVYDRFREQYAQPVLVFYINHLGAELTDQAEPFAQPQT
jgi:hypothetical protein